MSSFETWSLVVQGIIGLGALTIGVGANRIAKSNYKLAAAKLEKHERDSFKESFLALDKAVGLFRENGDCIGECINLIQNTLHKARLELPKAIVYMLQKFFILAIKVNSCKNRERMFSHYSNSEKLQKAFEDTDKACDAFEKHIQASDYLKVYSGYLGIIK